ncbi:MAG: DNA polymerase I [Armatimonadota bacterium]
MVNGQLPLLLLVDGYSLLFRAFFASRYLSTSQGVPTNAVYGFANMLIGLLGRYHPESAIVAFDLPEPTFRHIEYPAYKAHRPPTPEEFVTQIPYVKRLVEGLGFGQSVKPGFEADDLIGTYCRIAVEQGYRVVVLTGDGDSFQLVNDNVSIVMPQKGFQETTVYDAAQVMEKTGVWPHQIPDLKAMKGDSSDNIPGVPGIGDKTAAGLLAKWPTLEDIYLHIDEVKPERIKNLLVEHREQAELSKRLATIICDVDVEPVLPACLISPEAGAQLVRLMNELEFRSLARRVDALINAPSSQLAATKSMPESAPNPSLPLPQPPALPAVITSMTTTTRRVETTAQFDALMKQLDDASVVGCAIRWQNAQILDIHPEWLAVSLNPGEAWLLSLSEGGGLFAEPSPFMPVMKKLAKAPRVCISNSKNLAAYLLREKMSVPPLFDPLLANYVLDSSRGGNTIQQISENWLHQELPTTADPIGLGAEADATMRLMPLLLDSLTQQQVINVYEEIDLPLVPILAEMELNGIAADRDYLFKLSDEFQIQITKCEKGIYAEAGQEFNVASPKQLGQILFEKMGLPSGRKTAKGAWSTDSDVLESLAEQHPIARLLTEYREITKLRSTYADSLPRLLHPSDGRIHSKFNQMVTATGRLSSSDPNLQNIPVRSEMGMKIRQGFVAKPGYQLISADYSQIELRLLAHVCEEPRLIEAFEIGQDIHTATASILFDVPVSEVTGSQRRRAKTVNFGVLYGQSDFGLSNALGVSRTEAKAFITDYFARLPAVKTYIEQTVAFARQNGYVQTLFGRKRMMPDIRHSNHNVRTAAERAAVNSPLQGAAADLIKLAMIKLNPELADNGYKLCLQVHDDLMLEVPTDKTREAAVLLREAMTQVTKLRVPLEVDVKAGSNWAEMERCP